MTRSLAIPTPRPEPLPADARFSDALIELLALRVEALVQRWSES